MRKAVWIVVCSLVMVLAGIGAPATAAPPKPPLPGAPGIGDPYYPLDGNGGYDVKHYDLRLTYDPGTDQLRGRAEMRARATQSLSRFNLDLHGLTVDAIRVDGRSATWRRIGDELQITPNRPLTKGSTFVVVVRYHGVPGQFEDGGGVFPTADGAIVIGQPHVASSWYPVNDHPLDKASYRFQVTVPRGLEVVANGHLAGVRYGTRTATWSWVESAPMASYLATATIGQFRMTERYVDGIEIRDAIDPVLFRQPKPRTGSLYALSGGDDNGYKRLTRVIDVPSAGSRLTFWVSRDTEPDWDFFAVEARPAGGTEWTTLPDLNGHSSQSTGSSCPLWLGIHPFLTHYQTAAGEETCTPSGSTGAWHAASGSSVGYEHWAVDLSAYAGSPVELSLSVISDDVVSHQGVYLDDVVGPGGQGTTSFELDGDQLDGWTIGGPPAGSPGNTADWRVTDRPAVSSTGRRAAAALKRQPEILRFLSGYLGRYPFKQAGGIVDNDDNLGFALENQTRPIYSKDFFSSDYGQDFTSVVVHELAHQWTGDSVSLAQWQDIWLNEGFATYTEWLWSERQGNGTAQEIFDGFASIPADASFWSVVIGDPGPDDLFAGPVYDRGAMTVHALRTRIGDDAFFRLLKRWTAVHADGNATIAQFEALAERISGQDLDQFFQTWLYTGQKPPGIETSSGSARSARASAAIEQRVMIATQRPALRR